MSDPSRVSLYRFGRGYRQRELRWAQARLQELPSNLPADFAESPRFFTRDSRALVGRELIGLPQPGGLYERARRIVMRYEFADPRFVVAHFDPQRPLLGRTMLLEMRAWGFRFLGGVRVTAVRNQQTGERSSFGFRYDTLQGHLACGSESFTVTKSHASGEVWLRIGAAWRSGDFPLWWSRIGFALLGEHRQRAWHRATHRRMRELSELEPRFGPTPPLGSERAAAFRAPFVSGQQPGLRSEIPSERGSLAR